MSVLDGYNKYKRYIKTNDGYKLCSQWTSSNTVQMDDGNTLQTNLGAINGITDSLTATSSNIAASAAAVKTLNDSLNGFKNIRSFIGNNSTTHTVPLDKMYRLYVVVIAADSSVAIFCGLPRAITNSFDFACIFNNSSSGLSVSYTNGEIKTVEPSSYHSTIVYQF